VVSGLLSAARLLNHFLKLLTDYRSVKTIDGDACHAEAFLKGASRPYSVTTSTCLSITWPVKRSIATCAQ
jgi:hypothetical protein